MLLKITAIATIIAVGSTLSCASGGDDKEDDKEVNKKVYPHTDPENKGRWVLNPTVSDEFEGDRLNIRKWHIQGTGGRYQSNFIGRAPSQFSLDNVRLEDGKLKIQTRWEPDYDFHDEPDRSGKAYENITTAAVISQKQFYQGYMEIKAKAANASVTSAFWMTGSKSELDIFEHMGRPAQTHKKHLETEIWSSIHDWSKPHGETSIYSDRLQLPFRVADDFNVYACEWNDEGLIFYVNGEKIREVKKADVDGWSLNGPMWVWMDSETFPWHGLPSADDLPVDYEIEYVRIWQKRKQTR